jgi:hypothetical protein
MQETEATIRGAYRNQTMFDGKLQSKGEERLRVAAQFYTYATRQ